MSEDGYQPAGRPAGRSIARLMITSQPPDTDLPATDTTSSARVVHASISTPDAVSALSCHTARDPGAVAIHTGPAAPAAAGRLTLTLPAHSLSLVHLTLNAAATG